MERVSAVSIRISNVAAPAARRVKEWLYEITGGNLLVTVTIALNVLLVASTFILIHYFSVDAITSLLYVGVEQCPPGAGTVGFHCFGDYNLGSVLSLPNPWDYVTQAGPWNYPAASMAPSKIFLWLGNAIGHPKVSTMLYILLMVIGLTVPAIWAARGQKPWVRIAVWSMFGFLSIPALMAIDRGNIVGFAVPFMFLAMISIARDKPLAAAIGIALASCAKPQFGLAILIFAFLGRWLWLVVCAGIAAIVHLLPFLLWPQAFPGSILQAFSGMFSFGTYSTLESTIPVSVSFTNGAYLLEEWFIRPFRGSAPSWVEGHQGLVAAVIVLALLAVLFIARHALPPALTTGLIFLISALAVPTSFTYYFIAALPLAGIVLRNPSGPATPPEPGQFRGILELGSARRWPERLAAAFLTVTLAATVSRTYLPRLIPDMPYFIFTTAAFVTIMWMIAIPIYAIIRLHAYRRTGAASEQGSFIRATSTVM